MATQTNKQVKIATDANFNNNKIVNAKIDASENEITGVVEELQAGNGISISGNTISLKGTTQLPDETDIDTIRTEGNYFIDSPTSTYGLPTLPHVVMIQNLQEHGTTSGNVGKWLCLLLVEKQYGYGTYFIRQTVTFTPIVWSGMDYIASDTLMFTRILSDSTYPNTIATHSWTKIDGDRTTLYYDEHTRNQPMTISNLSGNYTYMVGFNSQYSITGLTLTNIENTPNEIQVIFKVTTDNFTLTAEQLQILNYNNIIFETGKTYILTIKNLYASITCNGEDINLKTFINKTIIENDLQKRLVAGNNVTITNYGWQGFSTTNNLELNTEHSDYVNLIKFNLNELNKNSIFFYTQYYDENLSEMLEGYLEITNENKLHVYYEYPQYSGYYGRYVKATLDYAGPTILQANKYYWITQKSQGFQPTLNYTYLIEDDGYTINSLPDISEWTQQFSTGVNSYILYSNQDYPAYIGYNPTNNNYFSGVIQEFKTTNFNLSTAVVGTDFINNGCVNGAVISATGGGGSSYTEGPGIYIDDNEIGMNRNTAFYNHLYINSKDDNIQDSDISFDESTFFTYTGGADNNFYNFIYMNGTWNLRVMDYSTDPWDWNYIGEVDLADYGITYSGTPFENGWFILAGNYLTGKTSFTVIMLSFSNIFLNGLLLTEGLDFTRNDNTITFINYTLKATDRIQVI